MESTDVSLQINLEDGFYTYWHSDMSEDQHIMMVDALINVLRDLTLGSNEEEYEVH
jgi:hypothetical protein